MTYQETKRQLEKITIGSTGSVNGHSVTRWTENQWEVGTWGKVRQSVEQAIHGCGFRSVGPDWITTVIQDVWSRAFASADWDTTARCRRLYDRRQYQTGFWTKEPAVA